MWLGLGNPWGWLALTGHHWPQLTKQVIDKYIKDKFKPIDSVWMIWYCGYAMWAYSLSVVPQNIGWWSPNPSSHLFYLPFYLLQVYGVLILAIEDYSRSYYSLHWVQVEFQWIPCFTYAHNHSCRSCPGPPAPVFWSILAMVSEWCNLCSVGSKYSVKLHVSGRKISVHKYSCLQFCLKGLF